jgi:hypothetical protein
MKPNLLLLPEFTAFPVEGATSLLVWLTSLSNFEPWIYRLCYTPSKPDYSSINRKLKFSPLAKENTGIRSFLAFS